MKIFIIEDEPAIREELVQLLQKYGYQCDSSDDFHHIVQAALSSGANLILLDINLPYQDGFQVCREIRQKSNLPIIVLTSRNSDFDELMSLNIGADDYIAKPYNAQILLARMLLTMLTELNERLSATILMVTHDAFSASYCNRILFIKDGQVFNELHRGTDTRKEFFTKILEVVSVLGGEQSEHL